MVSYRLVDVTKLSHAHISNDIDLVKFINLDNFNLVSIQWGNVVIFNVSQLFNYIPFVLDPIDKSVTIDVSSLNPDLETELLKFTSSDRHRVYIDLPNLTQH